MEYIKLVFTCLLIFYVNIFLSTSSVKGKATSGDYVEKELIKTLLAKYKKFGTTGRPVNSTSTTVTVSFGLALIQLMDIDEDKDTITLNTWHRLLWNDELLRWKPEDYGGIGTVRLPSSRIWTPDIVLYNSAKEGKSSKSHILAVVSHDGSVMLIPPTTETVICNIDKMYYPFDTQYCALKYGSWTYDGFKMDLALYDNREEIDVTDYVANNHWDLLEHSARKQVKYYPCCVEPYPDLTFTLTFKRVAKLEELVLFVPIGLLWILSLGIFWMPAKGSYKYIMGGFIFFSNFILLLYVGMVLKAALIAGVICVCMCSVSEALLWSVLTTNLAHKGEDGRRLPHCVRQVFVNMFGCILCVTRPSTVGVSKCEDDEKVFIKREWRALSEVVDRLLFALHLIGMASFAALAIIQARNP